MFWSKVGVKLNTKIKKMRKLKKNFDSGLFCVPSWVTTRKALERDDVRLRRFQNTARELYLVIALYRIDTEVPFKYRHPASVWYRFREFGRSIA